MYCDMHMEPARSATNSQVWSFSRQPLCRPLLQGAVALLWVPCNILHSVLNGAMHLAGVHQHSKDGKKSIYYHQNNKNQQQKKHPSVLICLCSGRGESFVGAIGGTQAAREQPCQWIN
ncbi:unnamed protein product, partial [Discosporangium mesarthrocarpum]